MLPVIFLLELSNVWILFENRPAQPPDLYENFIIDNSTSYPIRIYGMGGRVKPFNYWVHRNALVSTNRLELLGSYPITDFLIASPENDCSAIFRDGFILISAQFKLAKQSSLNLDYSFISTDIWQTKRTLSFISWKVIHISAIWLRGWAAGWHYLATDWSVSQMPSHVPAYS